MFKYLTAMYTFKKMYSNTPAHNRNRSSSGGKSGMRYNARGEGTPRAWIGGETGSPWPRGTATALVPSAKVDDGRRVTATESGARSVRNRCRTRTEFLLSLHARTHTAVIRQ